MNNEHGKILHEPIMVCYDKDSDYITLIVEDTGAGQQTITMPYTQLWDIFSTIRREHEGRNECN